MIRVFVCCLLLCAPASAACLISGTVLDGISGKPLPGTRVFAKRRAESRPPAILHVADASGAFCFERLDRGDYEIVADRTGYVPAVHGARPGGNTGTIFTVGPQTEIPALVLKMLPAASLSGIVTDSNGQALPGIDVNLLRKVWHRGWSTETIDIATADDRGAFSFSRLPPGAYYLRGDIPHLARIYIDENGGPFLPREAPTFYSGAYSINGAESITVKAGQELTGLSLAMKAAARRRMSGRVTGIATGPNEHAVMTLLAESSSFQHVVRVDIQPDGSFSAGNLYPIKYGANVSGTKQGFWHEAADLSAGDADGVVIAPDPPNGELRISIEGEGPSATRQLVMLNLDTGVTELMVRTAEGIYLSHIRAGRYRIKVRGNTEYIDHIVVDGRARSDAVVELRSGAATEVKAFLSPATARIRAQIDRSEGQQDSLAVTLVWEDVANSIAEVSGDWKTIPRTNSLEISPLAPGRYRVFAIEGFEEGPWGCPDLAAALADSSVTIDLKPGEVRQVTVPVILAAEWAAALHKIGL